MNKLIVGVLLIAVALNEIQGTPLNNEEKNKAKTEVTKKEEEVKQRITEIIEKQINPARAENSPELKNGFKDKGNSRNKKLFDDFTNEGIKSLKVAIEKNKPLTAYDCVVKVSVEGRKEINAILEEYNKKLNEIERSRNEELGNAQLLTDLIKFGLEKLVKETTEQIDNAKDNNAVCKLKESGLKKCSNALDRCLNLKERLLNLKKIESLYLDAEKAMNSKHDSVQKSLFSKLQACVK